MHNETLQNKIIQRVPLIEINRLITETGLRRQRPDGLRRDDPARL